MLRGIRLQEGKMDIQSIYGIENEAERVNALYAQVFREETRLTWSQAARVEFLTTVRYLEKYLRPGAKLLDVGAGAGEYSLHFVRQGYSVDAVELAEANVAAFQKRIEPGMDLRLRRGDARDLSAYAGGSFDVVLLLGPLYHLERAEDRARAIAEARRVCKKDGVIAFAFISNDIVPLTESVNCDPGYFQKGNYDRETFRLENFPFVFFTLDEMRAMLEESGVEILHAVASDGPSELLEKRINGMDQACYAQYLRWHFYTCEKPEWLGCSNHLLFLARPGK